MYIRKNRSIHGKKNKINKYIDRSIHEIEGDQFSFMLV